MKVSKVGSGDIIADLQKVESLVSDARGLLYDIKVDVQKKIKDKDKENMKELSSRSLCRKCGGKFKKVALDRNCFCLTCVAETGL